MVTRANPELRAGTLQRLLQDRAYFRDAPADTFRAAERAATMVTASSSEQIIAEGDASPYAWFLVEGSVALQQAGQPDRVLSAEDADAGYPVANLRPSRYTVRAEVAAKLVRLEQSYLKSVAQTPPPVRFLGGTEFGGGSWQNHPFAIEVLRLERTGGFKIPPLPGVSARISKALQDPDIAIDELARLIGADPAIAGGLISIANSALFGGIAACESLQAAIVRLGVEQTRTLVMTLAAKGLFVSGKSWVRKRLQTMWRHAVDMGSYATVLARLSSDFDGAKALLLGLLHEIGVVPVLQLADQYADLEHSPDILDAVLANLAPKLSVMTLEKWGLGEFALAAAHQEHWYYEHEGAASYTDLLIVAHLHGLIKARRFADLPRIDETPAFQQLKGHGMTASTSVAVLEEAQQELAELRALLT